METGGPLKDRGNIRIKRLAADFHQHPIYRTGLKLPEAAFQENPARIQADVLRGAFLVRLWRS